MSVEGLVVPGFEPVREALAANFSRHRDLGAAVCVYRDGKPVVDLWGGVADPHTARPWTRDTLAVLYSVTKGVLAAAAHVLVERRKLDLDVPVAQYWPDFAAENKAGITVRQLLSHQAGLPVLDKPVPLAEALTWQPMADALAAQRPVWPPGTAHGYHARTFGWLVGEVIRRVTDRSPGRFVADAVAAPLGLDLFIGLPESQRRRVARLIPGVPEPGAEPDPNSLRVRACQITNPPDIDFGSAAVQAAEIPSSNGIATARAVARMYAALIGEVEGARLFRPKTLANATREQVAGMDLVLEIPTRYACGFVLPTESLPLTGPRSFGHPGRGGSLAFADPKLGLAFAYLTNHIIDCPEDPRSNNLVEAVLESLR
ncbi:MAG: beta-lactamase family protein [Mycobacteriaceae bacterium]|nr:beta-lactamase family protein [Mycobacteriaceae bacterium]